jgi:hypothetical protein
LKPEKTNAVIEIDLRVGVRRRDRKVIVAEAGMKLRRRGRQGLMRVLRGERQRECERTESRQQHRGSVCCGFHGANLAPKPRGCQPHERRLWEHGARTEQCFYVDAVVDPSCADVHCVALVEQWVRPAAGYGEHDEARSLD